MAMKGKSILLEIYKLVLQYQTKFSIILRISLFLWGSYSSQEDAVDTFWVPLAELLKLFIDTKYCLVEKYAIIGQTLWDRNFNIKYK